MKKIARRKREQPAPTPRASTAKRNVKRLNVDVPADVYQQFRIKAVQDGTTMTEQVKTWIDDYVSR